MKNKQEMSGVILCILCGKFCSAGQLASFILASVFLSFREKLHYIDVLLLISRWFCSWAAAMQASGSARI